MGAFLRWQVLQWLLNPSSVPTSCAAVASNISLRNNLLPHALLTTANWYADPHKPTSLWGRCRQQAFKPVPASYPVEFPSTPNDTISSVQFSRSVVPDSLRPHEPQHARPPCLSPTPGVHPNPCPSSRWCHPAISSSVVPFSSCPQSLPASGSFQMSQLFTSGSQSIGVSASASVLPVNTEDWNDTIGRDKEKWEPYLRSKRATDQECATKFPKSCLLQELALQIFSLANPNWEKGKSTLTILFST